MSLALDFTLGHFGDDLTQLLDVKGVVVDSLLQLCRRQRCRDIDVGLFD